MKSSWRGFCEVGVPERIGRCMVAHIGKVALDAASDVLIVAPVARAMGVVGAFLPRVSREEHTRMRRAATDSYRRLA